MECGGPGLVWLHVVVRPVGHTVKFSKTTELSYGREINIQSLATALVDIAAVNMPIVFSLNFRHLWHCVV
jgi:hypothetical protein